MTNLNTPFWHSFSWEGRRNFETCQEIIRKQKFRDDLKEKQKCLKLINSNSVIVAKTTNHQKVE